MALDARFAEALRRFDEASEATDGESPPAHITLFRKYTELCQQAASEIDGRLSAAAGERLSLAARAALQHEAAVLRAERNTWYLLEWLFQDWPRSTTPPSAPPPPADGCALAWACADEQSLVEHIFEHDATLATAQAVVWWFESMAYEQVDYMGQDALHGNTLFRLASAIDTDGLCPMIDPDAPARTALPLDENDAEQERALLRGVWGLLRAGRVDEAQALCHECRQPWRAATLDGGRLWGRVRAAAADAEAAHVVQLGAAAGGGRAGAMDAWAGNPHRQLWLESCRHLAASADSPLERAIYGCLCGDVPAMLEASASAEDSAWARLKALVHGRVEEWLGACRARPDAPPPGAAPLTELEVMGALGCAPAARADGAGSAPADDDYGLAPHAAGGAGARGAADGASTPRGDVLAAGGAGAGAVEPSSRAAPGASALLALHGRVQKLLVLDRLRRGAGHARGRVESVADALAAELLRAEGRGAEGGREGAGGAARLLELRSPGVDSLATPRAAPTPGGAEGSARGAAATDVRQLAGAVARADAAAAAEGDAGALGHAVLRRHLSRFGAHLSLFLRRAVRTDAPAAHPAPSAAESALQCAYAKLLALRLASVRTAEGADGAEEEEGGEDEALLAPSVALLASKLAPDADADDAEGALPADPRRDPGASSGRADAGVRVLRDYLRRLAACAPRGAMAACLEAGAGAVGHARMCAAACAALEGIEALEDGWWRAAADEAARARAADATNPARSLRALSWLTLPVRAEPEALARTRLVHALVHANRLTAALVERGLASQLLAPAGTEQPLPPSSVGLAPGAAAAADAAAAAAGGADAAPPLRPLLERFLPLEAASALWSAEPTSAYEQRVNNAVAELLGWTAYLEALAAYHAWWSFASGTKPPGLRAAAASDPRQFDRAAEWSATLRRLAEAAAHALEQTLRAPHGWLEDHHDGGVPATGADAEAEARDRCAQLRRLQRACVPQMVELLHATLLQTARLSADAQYATHALQFVAELVADEHYRLYSHFPRARLQALLALLRKSALVVFELQAV